MLEMENVTDMFDFVTSLHASFGRKLAKLRGSMEDTVFNENANGKHQKTKMIRSTRWLSRLFKICGFLTPKTSKIHFFNGLLNHFLLKKRRICYSTTSRLPVYTISRRWLNI